MKKLSTALAVILVMVVSIATGCTNTKLTGISPNEAQEVVSSCVSCHTDKALLKEVAASEPVHEISEETSGEG
ncbi:hypothetical protein ACFLVB_00305 [Chloroflexota bacterium]